MDKSKKVTRVFQMNPDSALEFFIRVKDAVKAGAEDTEALRQGILTRMAKEGLLDRVYDTERSEEEIVEDYKRVGFNVEDRRGEKHEKD